MAKKPFLKLRRLYEDRGLLQKSSASCPTSHWTPSRAASMPRRTRGAGRPARSLRSARCYTFRRSRSGRISSRQSQRRKRPHETLHPCIRAGRAAHWMRVHRTAVLEQVVPLGAVVRHLAATSWADKSRMKATPGCRFLLMANGTRSSDGHWTTADPQSIVFRR